MAATNWPATPAAGTTTAASRAAPQPARNNPPISNTLTASPPSTAVVSAAMRKSWGTARGAASVRPSAASEKNDRGVDTASRSSR